MSPGRTDHARFGLRRQSGEIAGVSSAHHGVVAAPGELLQPELPHRLQHPEPRLVAASLLTPQQALVDQRGERIEQRRFGPPVGICVLDHCGGRIEIEPADKDGQGLEHGLVVGRQ